MSIAEISRLQDQFDKFADDDLSPEDKAFVAEFVREAYIRALAEKLTLAVTRSVETDWKAYQEALKAAIATCGSAFLDAHQVVSSASEGVRDAAVGQITGRSIAAGGGSP